MAIFSVWINRQALNTDNWVNTSDKVLQNKDVQSQLSIFLADQLFASVDVQAELQKSLPPRLQPLAGPASGALHQLAPQVAQRALVTPQFQTLWSQANRAAHETLLKIVDGGGSTVSTNNGQVTLDLTSELRVSTHFNLYAAPWADAIMRSIQENILEIIRVRAERQSPIARK